MIMAEPTYGAPTPEEPTNIDAPTTINTQAPGTIAAPGTFTTLPAQGLSPLEDLTPPVNGGE